MTTQEKIDLVASTDPFKLIDQIRNATIEECARVAENYPLPVKNENPFLMIRGDIPAAIRALKEKP